MVAVDSKCGNLASELQIFIIVNSLAFFVAPSLYLI